MIEFRVEPSWASDGYRLWAIERRQNGKSYIAKTIHLEFVEMEEGCLLPAPTLEMSGVLSREFVPALKKALAGLIWFDKEEDFDVSKRVEKAMQNHIDSLNRVIDRVTK